MELLRLRDADKFVLAGVLPELMQGCPHIEARYNFVDDLRYGNMLASLVGDSLSLSLSLPSFFRL